MIKIRYTILKRIQDYSGLLWVLSLVLVIALLAVVTNFATADPNFSPGGKESTYLAPFLILVALEMFSFFVFTLTWFVSFFWKDRSTNITHPLGITPKRVILTVSIILFSLFSFFLGIRQASVGLRKIAYSSQDLWNAVNAYRAQQGLPILELSQDVCFGISDRWKTISNNLVNNRPGHDEGNSYLQLQQSKGLLANTELIELFSEANTPQDAVIWWSNSPSHRLGLLDSKAKTGCAFWNYQDNRNIPLGLLFLVR